MLIYEKLIKEHYKEPSYKNALLYSLELWRARLFGNRFYGMDLATKEGDKTICTTFSSYKGKLYILKKREL